MRLGWLIGPAPVESYPQQRDPRAAVPVPDVGLRWGQRATFAFDLSQEEEDARDGGGVTLRYPAKTKTTERVIRFSPVWRRYDIMRVKSAEDPNQYVDIGLSREALIPIGEEMLLYIGGGIGYVEDPGQYGYTKRVLHTYVHLTIPAPALQNAEKIGEGTVGTWPDYPEDLYLAGTVAQQVGGTPYGDSGGWDR